MKNKQGISLIVLVITIIVMIILAAAIILSLNNAGIVGNANKTVAETNLAQMKDLASMSWGTAYAEDARTLDELKGKIEPELENAVGKELDNYEVTIGLKGITVVTKTEAPEGWKDSVTIILDGVPIPKGFVASKALGENTRDEGFVIYEKNEGIEEINDENVEWAKRNINQYVWIPVDNMNDFKRQNFGLQYNKISTTLGTDYWEVTPGVTYNSLYMLQKDLDEVTAMYASVEKYKGFYVARYESGVDKPKCFFDEDGETDCFDGYATGARIESKMNRYPNVWTEGVEARDGARSVYPDTSSNITGVISTLIYGVQWDTIEQWLLNTKAISDATNSLSYGNYENREIKLGEINGGAKYNISGESKYTEVGNTIKDNKTWWLLTTGALKSASTNNIYDLAGNAEEWTMEGNASNKNGKLMVIRGSNNLSSRGASSSTNITSEMGGYRVTLYIK